MLQNFFARRFSIADILGPDDRNTDVGEKLIWAT